MKISYNWLQTYFDKKLPSPEKLAEKLTMHAFEVEEVAPQGKGLELVVVGEVMEKKKHPNADKLSLVKIKISSDKVLNIVCGAPNIEAGQKVPVALIGAELPSGMKIEKREVRGEVSSGMVCSATELGLEKQSAGIMVLDKKAKIGAPIVKILGLDDFILDVAVLPNRSHDCLSHSGLAKEVSALFGLKLKEPKPARLRQGFGGQAKIKVFVDNKEPKLCTRYIARVIEDVEVKPSPAWLRRSLESIGQRPINNVVDATNFVMFEVGQPLHAFDADKLGAQGKGQTIVVRKAKNGEEIITLDDQRIELDDSILVIADAKNPVAIAGIKGGKPAGIDGHTKNIILESATFNQAVIRRASQKIGLRTDSSVRFENGISEFLAEKAMERVTEIILQTGGGKAGKKVDAYPKKVKQQVLEFNPGDVSKFLGVDIKDKYVIDTLKILGFGVKAKKGLLDVFVPQERLDIEYPEDLIEEVARMYGMYKIPSILPEETLIPPKRNDNVFFANVARDILVGAGFSEVYNYSFVQEGEVELANPIDKNKKFLKTNLSDGLKENVKLNSVHFKNIKIFEIGKIYSKVGETVSLAGIIHPGVFAEAKGAVEMLLEKLGIDDYYFEDHPEKLAEIRVGNSSIGYVDHNGFELNFDELIRLIEEEVEFSPISKYPAVKRDIALYVPLDVRVTEVEDVIENSGGELLVDSDLFDIYEGAGDERKSLAFHLIFQSHEKTLNEAEINELVNKVIKALEANPDWEVRKG